MKKATFNQRFRYWFDNFMSKGTPALLTGLFIISALIIFIAAGVVILTHTAPNGESFLEVAWMSLLRTLDSGTMGGDTGSPFFLFMMLVVTFGGVFVVSALIGVINNGLEDKLDELRKGRSQVLESEHTLILGWNPQIFTVISELVLANESRKNGAVIVVLAEQDKVEMEDAIGERVGDLKNTRVICRSGSPIDLNDLEIGSPHTARSIIILPEGDDPDTIAIKSVLALTNNPNRREGPYHIVTQIHDVKNLDVIKMLSTKDTVLPILASDLIARVVAQTSRQSGLSLVYTELMNFGGDEIYFTKESSLTGKTYADALFTFDTSTVMGIRKADGTTSMNPPMDTKIEAGDELFLIAEDDDKIIPAKSRLTLEENLIQKTKKNSKPRPERALILGWNRSGGIIVRELDNYVVKGSEVTIVADLDDLKQQVGGIIKGLKNQKVKVQQGDIRSRELLEALEAAEYDHVIVLAYNHLPIQEADAITLVTLLHLRDIAEKDETPFSIVSEMLDLRNRELAEAAKVDDFIVSEHLVSLMMAQLSENEHLFDVFTDMFSPVGSEIYLKPATDYISIGQPVSFGTVVEAARRKGETAIGFRIMSQISDSEKSFGVRTNPKKTEKVTFTEEDKVIVLAGE